MIYVLFADGFEELEAIAPVDILRRAGKEVITVGVTGKTVLGSHGIPVVCDCSVDDVVLSGNIEAVVLPGGMPGTLNLEKSEAVQKLLDFAKENNKIIGAICAAPSILGHKGFLKGKKATCFNGFEKELIGAEVLSIPTVKDGNIITAFGAGAAFEFGYALLKALTDEKTSENMKKSMRFGENNG